MARAHALLIKYWVEKTLHPLVTRMTVLEAWQGLHEMDKGYFRESREKRFGKRLEEVVADRDQTLIRFREALEPLRAMLADQPYVSGAQPAFADYIVVAMFQWARRVSAFELLAPGDPVTAWRQALLERFDAPGVSGASPEMT